MRPRQAFTLLELMIVIALLSVIAALMVPNLVASRKAGYEAGALGALKAVSTTEVIFREGDKEKDGNFDYGMLSELANANLVDSMLGGGTKQGYRFQASYSFARSEFLWFGIATPLIVGTTGDRYFETNVSGLIYYTTKNALPLDTLSCLLPTPGTTAVGK
jgi:prepilin-type N-terminal cleavage/methylation domain-containing protein